MVKNPPSKAGDAGLIPGWGTKIPHAAGQLSLHATTTELACFNERAQRARALQVERSLHAATKARRGQKKKKKITATDWVE